MAAQRRLAGCRFGQEATARGTAVAPRGDSFAGHIPQYAPQTFQPSARRGLMPAAESRVCGIEPREHESDCQHLGENAEPGSHETTIGRADSSPNGFTIPGVSDDQTGASSLNGRHCRLFGLAVVRSGQLEELDLGPTNGRRRLWACSFRDKAARGHPLASRGRVSAQGCSPQYLVGLSGL